MGPWVVCCDFGCVLWLCAAAVCCGCVCLWLCLRVWLSLWLCVCDRVSVIVLVVVCWLRSGGGEGGRRRRKGADIKSNNPHLTGVESCIWMDH